MSVTGFGICGQKNSYSSRTKCGNWVEDRIGKAIAAKLKDAPRQGCGSTVERDDFIPPAMMADKTVLPGDKTVMLSAADIKNKNREGVSFDLLFGHVRDSKHADALQQDRFVTNTLKSFAPTATDSGSGSSSRSTGGATPTSTRVPGCSATSSSLIPPRQSRIIRQRIAEVARERRQVESLTTTARLQSSRAS